ncbi:MULTISPECIES: hypothetical protein [Rhizobium/Agrobacterium group]|uniref:Uncharacterized protein n=1 Tax=Agrobacterium vitis TaxID=373 RepID=A0AAE2UV77_AGRVI|nr:MULTISPECIES: hypothetical protein [Rhizobium/Agrobacterium group]MBF2715475.1 hypothetical protein [Agrobacterium vitis]MUO31492.1 hypothetical protein [Agrobacterium vitis]MUO45300.1 hypothetical protein [Agrobacterium vitis]MUP13210.1 hypothetical protein [Agrobacterium vitis]MVA61758.1 hypothetical protein [Agrobacterium vitis]
MKKLVVPVEIPVDQLADAVGPLVIKALRAAEREDEAAVLRRPPIQALIQAGRTLWHALNRYEASEGTRDERRALNALLAASKGVRNAVKTIRD